MTTGLIAIATVVVGYCLWRRRHTWAYEWEVGSTITVAGMAGCLLLMSPALAPFWSPPLHALTGLWNVEDLLGHLAYLLALTTLTHTLTSRLNLADPRLFLRKWLEIPITLTVPLLIGLFILSAPKKPVHDLFLAPVTGWMTCYWIALCTAASYLIVNLLRVLRIMRTDPRSRTVADIYIAAIIIDCGCLASILLSRIIPSHPVAITWFLLCAAASGYAIAPAYPWHRKTAPPIWPVADSMPS